MLIFLFKYSNLSIEQLNQWMLLQNQETDMGRWTDVQCLLVFRNCNNIQWDMLIDGVILSCTLYCVQLYCKYFIASHLSNFILEFQNQYHNMQRKQQRFQHLKTIIILTTLSIALILGAIIYQIIADKIGLNTTQLHYTICGDPINTILSNSNLFFIISLISAAVGTLLLIIGGVTICCGVVKYGRQAGTEQDGRGSGQRQEKYIDLGQMNKVSAVSEGGDTNDAYFNYCKFVVFSVLYTLAFITILGHFGLILSQLVGLVMCEGVIYITLMVISILSAISCILTLICMIICQIQACKHKNKELSKNLHQQTTDGLTPQKKQGSTYQNTNGKAGETGNGRMQTLYPLNTQNQDDGRKSKNGISGNKGLNSQIADQKNNTNTNSRNDIDDGARRKEQIMDYVSFNQNAKVNVGNDNKQLTSAAPKDSPMQTPNQSQLPHQQKLPSYFNSSLNQADSQDIKNGSKNDRSSQMGTLKDSKHPTPKFIIQQSSDNSAFLNTLSNSNNAQENEQRNFETFLPKNILSNLGDESKKERVNGTVNNYEDQISKQQKQKDYDRSDFKDENRQSGGYRQKEKEKSRKLEQPREARQVDKLQQQQKKTQILRKTGYKPFFRSPNKQKQQSIRFPLQQFQSKNNDYDTRQHLPQKQPQAQPQPSLSTSLSSQKLREEQRKYIESQNYNKRENSVLHGPERNRYADRDGRGNNQLKGYPQTQLNRQKQELQGRQEGRKSDVLINYIRSRYAD